MAIADYELYERLKPKLGQEETRALLDRFDRLERELPERVRREAATKEDLLRLENVTKADLQELREEFLKSKVEIIERIHGLERRIDRVLYAVVVLFLIFNGDKVVTVFRGLLQLGGG